MELLCYIVPFTFFYLQIKKLLVSPVLLQKNAMNVVIVSILKKGKYTEHAYFSRQQKQIWDHNRTMYVARVTKREPLTSTVNVYIDLYFLTLSEQTSLSAPISAVWESGI